MLWIWCPKSRACVHFPALHWARIPNMGTDQQNSEIGKKRVFIVQNLLRFFCDYWQCEPNVITMSPKVVSDANHYTNETINAIPTLMQCKLWLD